MKDSVETMDSEHLIATLTAALPDKERELENRPNITKQQAEGLFQWTADVLEATGTSDGEAALKWIERAAERLGRPIRTP